MAYGTIKADSLIYDSSGSDVTLNLANVVDKTGATFTGNIVLNAQTDVRFADADSSNYVGFQAPATISSNLLYTLPGADGSAGQQLTTDGSGTLSWAAATNVAAASLSGTTMAANVVTSSLTSVGTLTGLTINGDVTFTGASSNGGWDKSENKFTGNLVGNVTGTADVATQFTVTANNTTDETVYPLFADGATGSQGAETDTGLTYNPSTGVLTAVNFAGIGSDITNLNASNIATGTIAAARVATLNQNTTGNAATADHADVADTVDITNTQTDAAHYLAFTNGDGAGKTVGIDGNLEYNPSTNQMSAKHLYLSGNYTNSREAITASSAPTIDCSTGNYFTLTQNQNVSSWTISNVPAAGRAYAFTLELQNSSYSTAWSGFSNLKWPNATAPTLSASKAHLIMFVTDDGGSNWRGAAIVDYTV